MGLAIMDGSSVCCCFSPPHVSLVKKGSCRPYPLLRLPTSPPVSRTLNFRISTHARSRIGIAFANLNGTNFGENLDSDATPPPSSKEASFNIKLPRRNLMVQFTCNACGERTHRTINRAAYQRETVFLQCVGCLVYHKFVDNLGLVVEYDLREDR